MTRFIVCFVLLAGCLEPGPGAITDPPDTSVPDVTADAAPDVTADAEVSVAGPCHQASDKHIQGEGTDSNPFLVCLPQHFGRIGAEPYGMDKVYALGADLDMVNYTSPIALMTTALPRVPFTGTFDGRGHRLDGLANAVFDEIAVTGFVTALKLIVRSDDGEWHSRGALANTNRGVVTRVVVHGTLLGGPHLGMLIGTNDGIVEECFSHGVVIGNWAHVGGLVGVNTGTISRSGSAADVTAGGHVGGLVGRQSAPGFIIQSFSRGAVSGDAYVGGLVGSLFGGDIRDSYATSSAVVAHSEPGGLIGQVQGCNPCTLVNTYAASACDAEDARGLIGTFREGDLVHTTGTYYLDEVPDTHGQPLSSQQMATSTSFDGWDFEHVWRSDGDAWPSLRFEQDLPAGTLGAPQF